MSIQLWVRMAGYRNYITYAGQKLNHKLRMAGYRKYISYRYVFISSLVLLENYAGLKLNNLTWLRMAGCLNYISSRYVFISSFISLTNYLGQKMNNLMWLRMVGESMSIYTFGYALSSQLWLRMAGYRNYLSSTYVFYL